LLPPKTYITSIRLQGHDEAIEKYAERIDSFSHLPVKLKLPPNRKSLTFEWIGVSFSIPEKVRYQYKLESIDEQWSNLTDRTSTDEYKNLTNGKYTFLVKAFNNDGVGNPEPVSFSFEIMPPFWKTLWFILLEIAAGFGLIMAFIRYRERQLIQEKKILEQKVEERTAEIQKQKKEIEIKNDELVEQQHEILAQRDEIQRQRDVAENQRDQITLQKKEITDSIHYARRIQTAVLPSEEYQKSILGEYFLLYKPRDIVSGDFYWMTKQENKVIVTAADCTGHGVPGAFMSMLGVSLLNEIVNKEKYFQANEILNKLRDYIKTTLSQTGKENEAKDGMDIAMVVLDLDNNQLEFAGANNPLYIVRKGELIEIKGDNMPIGIHGGEERRFKNNIIPLEKDDMVYIFSDGYADQFGGPDGGKFKTKPFKRLFTEISARPAFQQWILLEEAIEGWKGALDQVDDILVIGIRV
jgi:serine phosphatase RsbU (regulator of sigma subunit)